jgi:HNH endonuclease
MTSYIPAALRQLVLERAEGRCEYCRFPQDAAFLTFEIDHIIAEKHSGATVAENLALACVFCNSFKGTDLGSLDPDTGQLTPFFNPRIQLWDDHFRVEEDGRLQPITPEGRVTVAILHMNDPERVLERQLLLQAGRYP